MIAVQHLPRNDSGRDFVVGDIHGCFDKLRQALNDVAFNEARDRLFSVGDLVDRGTQSDESIDWIAKPWFHAVRGNHEQMAIGVAAGRHDLSSYLVNGGAWFMGMTEDRQRLYAEIFDGLPIAIEIETSAGLVGVIHADLGDYTDWHEFTAALGSATSNNQRHRLREIALWSRTRISYGVTTPIDGVRAVYVGHTPVDEVKRLGNVIYIDTGAVFGKKLTVVQLEAA